MKTNLDASELGKKSVYDAHYDPGKLFAISRKTKREEIGVPEALPFTGYDVWNHYEVSWLNPKGKPVVAMATLSYACDTPNIIESKSMKLYFNSLNNSKFEDVETIEQTISSDIAERVGGAVQVTIKTLPFEEKDVVLSGFEGVCIDNLDIDCNVYDVNPGFLHVENEEVKEGLYSNLLKSNCLVTHQPDWASVQISYQGKRINHEGLLRYLISFRNHNEFHEQCIERIFMDIMRFCAPSELTVYGRYTRRGGLDINPLRTTKRGGCIIKNNRLCRQ